MTKPFRTHRFFFVFYFHFLPQHLQRAPNSSSGESPQSPRLGQRLVIDANYQPQSLKYVCVYKKYQFSAPQAAQKLQVRQQRQQQQRLGAFCAASASTSAAAAAADGRLCA